jgi:hypothetical protein
MNNWYARKYYTGELVASTCYQPFVLNQSISLKAIRLTVILYNNPTLTGLQAHIYSNRGGVPYGLIASSTNDWDKSEISTYDNAARQIYFEFSQRHLNGSDTYHIVLTSDTYTGTDSSHIAWKLNFPDGIYTNDMTEQVRYLNVWPQELVFIGSEL